MSDTPTPSEAPSPRVHPTVGLDYRVRLAVFPLYFVLFSVHLWSRGVSPWAWAVFIWQIFAWPHVAYLVARRSRDSKRAEQRNLIIDSFFIGAAVPFTGYSLWPNAASVLGVNAGNIAVGGPRFGLVGTVVCLAGAATSASIIGFHPDFLGASLITQLLSIVAIFAFLTVFARQTFVQSRSVIRSNRMIREQSAQIEDKGAQLEERSRELQLALTEAESASRAKGSFLANMSHELRTPLNSIIGFANILLRNREGNLSSQDQTYLTRITANGSHLLTLINGVLDLSKIEARQMHLDLTSVDVAELVRETLSEMEPQAEARLVELVAEVPELALITTDRSRLKQIMLNLIGNAVKFTPNGRVVLRVTTDELTGRPSRLDVIDTGVGIAPDRLAAVFDAFQQEDTTTARQYGGTGLGLTITRSLAHLLGWDVTATSELGRGSTFSVIMQRALVGVDTPRDPLDIAPLTAGADRAFRVLVIDDELDARTILQHQLEEFGCEVVTAATADEGIALGRRVKPDLITLDIMMPRRNGWDALRDLKAIPELRDVPVVIVSVVAREKRGRLLGAVDFIDKPVARDTLWDVIRRNVQDARRPRVLLVHDRHADVHQYRELAATDDMTLEAVTSIDAATEALHLAAHAPDLVLLDMDRWTAHTSRWVASLREQPATVHVRVVVVVSDPAVLAEEQDLSATLVRRGSELTSDIRGIVRDLRARASNRPAA